MAGAGENGGILDKDVTLRFSGSSKNLGIPEGVEIIYPGRYYQKNGWHYILYEESSDESEKTLDVKCILKITKDCLEVKKQGTINSSLVFSVGSPNISIYQTPYGELSLRTSFLSLDIQEEKHLLSADLNYSLEINDDYAEECHLVLMVTD